MAITDSSVTTLSGVLGQLARPGTASMAAQLRYWSLGRQFIPSIYYQGRPSSFSTRSQELYRKIDEEMKNV